jgi:anti-sigma factor (TIGR02949 family)
MSGCDDKLLLLQAHLDGELDAANALALEAHLRTCAACAQELARMEALRGILKGAGLDQAAPPALRDRIEAMISTETAQAAAAPRRPARTVTPPRPRFSLAGGGAMAIGGSWGSGLATGLALSLALVVALPQLTRVGAEDQLVANHIRSLSIGSHLTDIATSDRHVVKPWFNGKIDFAPRVPELASRGFPLVGGRLDVVDGHEVAAIVYKRRLHTINVFVRPAPRLALPLGITAKHDGYSVVRWTESGLEYWAVSDIDLADLEQFRRSFASEPSL